MKLPLIKTILVITAAKLALFVSNAHAWNYKGHVSIAQFAYNELSKDLQAEVDALIEPIYENLPSTVTKYVQDAFPTANKYASLAILPDKWSRKTASEFFAEFGAELPQNLEPYKDEVIKGWHFTDMPYPKKYGCKNDDPNGVRWAIYTLEAALNEDISDTTKGVILILLTHFVADCHQPLHTVSEYNKECVNDEGGNLFCVHPGKTGKCIDNLHKIWDSAIFFFNNNIPVELIDMTIKGLFPKNKFTEKELSDLDPYDWAEENYSYAEFIFNLEQNEGLTYKYEETARPIAIERSALAGYRLNLIVSKIFF